MLSASLPVWTVVFYPHICWAICFLPVFVLYAVIVIHVDLQINAFIRTPIHHAWLTRDASVILTWIQMKKIEQNVSITNWSMNYLLSRILIIKLTRLNFWPLLAVMLSDIFNCLMPTYLAHWTHSIFLPDLDRQWPQNSPGLGLPTNLWCIQYMLFNYM